MDVAFPARDHHGDHGGRLGAGSALLKRALGDHGAVRVHQLDVEQAVPFRDVRTIGPHVSRLWRQHSRKRLLDL